MWAEGVDFKMDMLDSMYDASRENGKMIRVIFTDGSTFEGKIDCFTETCRRSVDEDEDIPALLAWDRNGEGLVFAGYQIDRWEVID